MKSRIVLWSFTSALAGFLFGFDTVVISGAEQAIQSLWVLSDAVRGLAVASALYGTVFGALLGGWPTDRFGRKPTLVGIGVLYVVSAVGYGLAWDAASFTAARFLGGVGIGVWTVAAPLYIAEIAPPAYRGRLAGLFQFNIVFGIVVAYGSNYLLRGVGADAWRWMLGVAAAPALAYTALCLAVPESPGGCSAARGTGRPGCGSCGRVRPEATAAEAEAGADAILVAARDRAETGPFWSRQLRKPILLAVLVAVYNQLSGINAVLSYAPRIVEGRVGVRRRPAPIGRDWGDQLHQTTADIAQVFLGIRLQCARCHHHPYERWGQADYYGLAGFFARLGRKSFGEPPPYYPAANVTTGERNPLTGKAPEPKYPDGLVAKFAPEDDPRHALVDWMARPDNPFIAKALVNRQWSHFFARGIVSEVDDLRGTNPPSNPELLDALTAGWRSSSRRRSRRRRWSRSCTWRPTAGS